MTGRFPLLRREFPDFDVATLPAIPAEWVEQSWHNDSCPSWVAPNGVVVFVDFANAEDREFPECERYSARAPDTAEGTGDELAFGDDWLSILNAVANFKGAA